MALIDELVQKITVKADAKALDIVQKKEQKLIATTEVLGNSLKSAFRWLGGGLLAKSIVDANITMDGLTRSFEALAGGAEAGAEQIEYLRKEANRLGQDFVSISGAYKNFFAVGKGAGMQTSETQNIFTSILEASTVLGSSAQSTEGALLAVEQMISKGKVSMEELRRQLGNALPGAFQIASKAMGVTTAELEKLISKGLDSQEFVKKFAEELKKNYSGDKLTGPVKSLRAEFARLKNAWFDFRVGLLEGDTGKAFAEMIREVTKLITSEGFRTAIKTISVFLGIIIKNIKLIVSTFIFSKFLKFITGVKTLGSAIGLLSKTGGITKMATALSGMAKAGWLALIPYAKLALILVALHDLIVALFDKDLQERLAEFLEKHKWLQALVPTYPIGKAVSAVSAETEKIGNSGLTWSVDPFTGEPTFVPQKDAKQDEMKQLRIEVNQYIQSGNPDLISDRLVDALNNRLLIYDKGGLK